MRSSRYAPEDAFEIIHTNSAATALSLALEMESMAAMRKKREVERKRSEMERSLSEVHRRRRHRRRCSNSRRMEDSPRRARTSRPGRFPMRFKDAQPDQRSDSPLPILEVAEEGQEAMWVEKEIFIVSSKQLGWQSRPPAKRSKTQIERSVILPGPRDVPISSICF
jgi:hypothetical protein